MRIVISYLANIFIIGLFLYSKLLPYKDKLNSQYIGIFNILNKVFAPILIFLKRFIKPFQVGQGLLVDMTQILLLILLLLIINTF
jgi:hypothetical protein